jgi:hypothetical protein
MNEVGLYLQRLWGNNIPLLRLILFALTTNYLLPAYAIVVPAAITVIRLYDGSYYERIGP